MRTATLYDRLVAAEQIVVEGRGVEEGGDLATMGACAEDGNQGCRSTVGKLGWASRMVTSNRSWSNSCNPTGSVTHA